nr:type I-B CRISPR-associated protein Cas5b [uncultured Marinifilum sp.]
MKKLISFRIKADKGFLKKPDINDGMYLTYNMLHKPAILGVLGAIAGLEGYKKNQELPEYYKILKDLPVGVRPLNDEKGNFQKTIITYNNTTGFASEEAGGNLMVTEQTLIKPSYEIFLLLDIEKDIQKKLYQNICNQEAVFLPYLGKNDYSLWWDKTKDVTEYKWEAVTKFSNAAELKSIFNKNGNRVQDMEEKEQLSDDLFEAIDILKPDSFYYFERLPVGFNEKLYQYNYADFSYTNVKLNISKLNNIYCLNNKLFIQLN